MTAYEDYIEVIESVVGEGFDREMARTRLLTAIPNMNSLTLVHLVQRLESKFDFQADMSMISTDTFESLGSLKDFVESSR